MHLQPLVGSRRRDQVHYDLVGFQRDSLPVSRDVAEKTMLDPVPLAGSGRVMTKFDFHY